MPGPIQVDIETQDPQVFRGEEEIIGGEIAVPTDPPDPAPPGPLRH
jgi:hypothetical protein